MENTIQRFMTSVKMLKIADVSPNKYNPQFMSEKDYEQMKEYIRREGFYGAILVRENQEQKEKYIIIDGEHRWKALKELGYEDIPAIVVNKKTPEAMIATLMLNKLHGSPDVLKVASILKDLMDNYGYSMDELTTQTGWGEEDIKGMEELTQFNPNDFERNKEIEADNNNEPEIQLLRFEVSVTKEQYEIINKALEIAKGDEVVDSLLKIMEDYIKQNGKG